MRVAVYGVWRPGWLRRVFVQSPHDSDGVNTTPVPDLRQHGPSSCRPRGRRREVGMTAQDPARSTDAADRRRMRLRRPPALDVFVAAVNSLGIGLLVAFVAGIDLAALRASAPSYLLLFVILVFRGAPTDRVRPGRHRERRGVDLQHFRHGARHGRAARFRAGRAGRGGPLRRRAPPRAAVQGGVQRRAVHAHPDRRARRLRGDQWPLRSSPTLRRSRRATCCRHSSAVWPSCWSTTACSRS